MKILLTGANGYLGRIVLEEFSKAKIETIALTRNLKNVPHNYRELDSVSWIEYDLKVIENVQIDNIDAIIHLAAQSSPNGVSCIDYMSDNVIATQTLVNFAKRNKIDTIIYSSAMSVYGEVNCNEVTELTPRINPDIYGQSKYLAEKILEESEVNSLVVRLPGIVGNNTIKPWFAKVFHKLKNNEDIMIFNSHNKFNNFVYAKDFAEFCKYMLKRNNIKNHDVLTMSCSGYMTVLELVTYSKTILSSTSDISSKLSKSNSFTISNKKLKDKYNFEPSSMKSIIERLSYE